MNKLAHIKHFLDSFDSSFYSQSHLITAHACIQSQEREGAKERRPEYLEQGYHSLITRLVLSPILLHPLNILLRNRPLHPPNNVIKRQDSQHRNPILLPNLPNCARHSLTIVSIRTRQLLLAIQRHEDTDYDATF